MDKVLEKEYPKLQIQLKESKMFATVGDFLYQVDESDYKSCNRMQKFIDNEEKLIENGYHGSYMIIREDYKIMISDSESGALEYQDKHPNTFIQHIGSCGPDIGPC